MNDDIIHNAHTGHCCLLHGCKYGKDDICTVTTMRAKQESLCETCSIEGRFYEHGLLDVQKIIDDLWGKKQSKEKYVKAKIAEVQKAYAWIRTNNANIPDDVLDLMRDAAIKALKGL